MELHIEATPLFKIVFMKSNDGSKGTFIALSIVFAMVIFVVIFYFITAEKNLYIKAKISQSIEDFEEYYYKYPDGKYVNETIKSICDLVAQQDSFKSDEDTSYIVYSYIDKYQNTSLEQELIRVAYNEMDRRNTEEGWRIFINNVPYQYQSYGVERLEQLEDVKWGTDENAWTTAQKMNTIDGYSEYMKRYPFGKYYKKAQKNYIDLIVSYDFANEHGDLPSMSVMNGYTNSGGSRINIGNQTDYLLTIYYSGPQSEMVEIPAHKSQSIRLKNGSYNLSARVSAPNVLPYVGTEDLVGYNYESYFYIQRQSSNYNSEIPMFNYDI